MKLTSFNTQHCQNFLKQKTDYEKLYVKAFEILGDFTPLTADCGRLCDGACCKGDDQTGMRLFPFEKTALRVIDADGERLAVCDGTCDRAERPLACRIFPFFPTVDEKGRVFVELDPRGTHVCPLVSHSDDVLFDKRFLRAVKKVGKLLAKDPACRKFLEDTTAEIDTYAAFLEDL